MNPFEMTAEDCDRCRFVKDCTPLYVPPCYDGAAVKAAKQARAEVLDEANLIFIRVVDDIAENGDANWHKCDMLDKMQSVWCEVESLRQQEGKR